MNTLLARYAESLFWMARYVERAENLARLLEVQETFARDRDGGQNWLPIVHLHGDHGRFFERQSRADALTVCQFYILDGENGGSILSAITAARENARALRPLISTEMWTHLNVFYNRMRELKLEDLTRDGRVRVCAMIKESCQTHTGITEGTFFRDQGWHFYGLGRVLERADATTRLIDAKVSQLGVAPDPDSARDVARWNTVLRSAAGYHAFRRIHPRGMNAEAVVQFLLRDGEFPRSVAACVTEADRLLHGLRQRYYLRGGGGALERLDELRAILGEARLGELLDGTPKLHQFLDQLQVVLADIGGEIATDFFGGE
jgi:uncharacterized alpha-E superfamily protein